MKSTTFSILRRNGAYAFRPSQVLRRPLTRFSSTETDASLDAPAEPKPLQETLRASLTSRPLIKTVDYISNQPWSLLNASLADFLPPSFQTPLLSGPGGVEHREKSVNNHALLPQGFHLIYFPPAVPGNDLLPDGTDNLHSPGAPFTKRLWAGGSLIFNPKEKWQIQTNKLGILGEDISSVTVKGNEGQEKVFVEVQRRIFPIGSLKRRASSWKKDPFSQLENPHKTQKHGGSAETMGGPWAVKETRNLVFLREKSAEEIKEGLERVDRVVKSPHTPDFSITLTPDAHLLFRFSALTFNAHRIHLDPQYTRDIEGHRGLLVHGPLTLVLMLSVLRSQLAEGKMILKFDYKNLAPLYVDEEMKICVRRDGEREDRMDIWVEGKEGGLKVKGTAVVGDVERSPVKAREEAPQAEE